MRLPVFGLIMNRLRQEEVNPKVKNSNIVEEKANKSTVIDSMEVMDQIQDIIDQKIKFSEIRAIAEAADYDIDKVKAAYDLSKKAKNIDNFVGWMISAIKNDYKAAGSGNSSIVGKYVQSSFNYSEEDLLDN